MRMAAVCIAMLAVTFPLTAQEDSRAVIISLQRTVVSLQAKVDSLEGLLGARGTPPHSPSSGTGVQISYAGEGTFSLWGRLIQMEEPDDDAPELLLAGIPGWISIGDSDHVRRYVSLHTTTRRSQMESAWKRYTRLLPMMENTFSRFGVPKELCALCIVESAVNRYAVSRAGAVGLWQIMRDTGLSLGMAIGEDMDERNNPERSTEVAARYLSRAYQILGDWRLAVMSYNCGIGAVQNAVRKAGGRTGYDDVVRFVPEETQAYIPSLVGVLCFLEMKEAGL